jgi:hypothetical protein
LLIEVKPIAKEDDKTTEVYGRYLEKARLVNLIPTLTVVKARKENNSPPFPALLHQPSPNIVPMF